MRSQNWPGNCLFGVHMECIKLFFTLPSEERFKIDIVQTAFIRIFKKGSYIANA